MSKKLEVNIKIKSNYKRYQRLLKDQKTTNERIVLSASQRKDTVSDSINVNYKNEDCKTTLNIAKRIDLYKYSINLRCNEFTEKPIFRFDSDGATHRNKNLNIPLIDQVITTPHFHKFHSDGVEIAYKNEILIKENNAKAIQTDIDFGLVLFYNEVNINSGNAPKVEYETSQLFDDKNNDPLSSIDFVI